jgi:hypothetical protein
MWTYVLSRADLDAMVLHKKTICDGHHVQYRRCCDTACMHIRTTLEYCRIGCARISARSHAQPNACQSCPELRNHVTTHAYAPPHRHVCHALPGKMKGLPLVYYVWQSSNSIHAIS